MPRAAMVAALTATAFGGAAATASASPLDPVRQTAGSVTGALSGTGSAPQPAAPAQPANPAPVAKSPTPTGTVGDSVGQVVKHVTAPAADAVDQVTTQAGAAPAAASDKHAATPVAGVVDKVAKTAAPVLDSVTPVAQKAAKTTAPVLGAAAPIVEQVTRTAAPVLGATTPIVNQAIAPLKPALDGLVNPLVTQTIEPVVPLLTGALPALDPVLGATNPIVGALDPILGGPLAPVTHTVTPALPSIEGNRHTPTAPTIPGLPVTAQPEAFGGSQPLPAPAAPKFERWVLDTPTSGLTGARLSTAFSSLTDTFSQLALNGFGANAAAFDAASTAGQTGPDGGNQPAPSAPFAGTGMASAAGGFAAGGALALLLLTALLAPKVLRTLKEGSAILRPTPFIALLERPG